MTSILRSLYRPLPVIISTAVIIKSNSNAVNSFADSNDSIGSSPKMPALLNMQKKLEYKKRNTTTLDSLMIIPGTAHPALSAEVAKIIGVPLSIADISRFADGEVSIQIGESTRGKDAFVIQSCSAPVNDSIMELLLTVSALRRSGVKRVTAVIPYFGYKHHRRGTPISTLHNSRFLSSGAMDFAKMLTVMGIDRVISVDLQRPGQGGEACFFDNNIPLETIITTNYLVNYMIQNVPLKTPIVVVAPNSECVQKARKFQLKFMEAFGPEVKLASFFHEDSGTGPIDLDRVKMLGISKIEGADVVIIDDIVDTAGTIAAFSDRLHAAGARNIYVCASHGLFTEQSIEKIKNSKINRVMVTNTLPLPKDCDETVTQVSIAPLLADVILAEHFRCSFDDDEDVFQMDYGEDSG